MCVCVLALVIVSQTHIHTPRCDVYVIISFFLFVSVKEAQEALTDMPPRAEEVCVYVFVCTCVLLRETNFNTFFCFLSS